MLIDLRLSDELGPSPCMEGDVLVQLMVPGGFIFGEFCFVCAEGLFVSCATSVRAGQRTILRVADAVFGIEYTIPCAVEWAHTGSPSAMALRVDGEPTRMSFAIPLPGMW